MKVICKCKTRVEVTVVGGQYQYTYEGTCPKCKTMWQLIDVINECDEEELPNIPVECENEECADCPHSDWYRQAIDCPYPMEVENEQ